MKHQNEHVESDLSKAVSADDFLASYRANPENERLFRESEVRFDVSERMKSMRKTAAITQTELGKRVGCTQSFIAKMEAGAYDRCGIGTLRTYARAMGQDISVPDMFKIMPAAVFNGKSSCAELQQSLDLQDAFPYRIASIAIKAWSKSQESSDQSASKAIGPRRKVTGAAA